MQKPARLPQSMMSHCSSVCTVLTCPCGRKPCRLVHALISNHLCRQKHQSRMRPHTHTNILRQVFVHYFRIRYHVLLLQLVISRAGTEKTITQRWPQLKLWDHFNVRCWKAWKKDIRTLHIYVLTWMKCQYSCFIGLFSSFSDHCCLFFFFYIHE